MSFTHQSSCSERLLVVVGSWHLSRRRGSFSSASVALPLTAHAPCPVVVVREPEHTAQQPAYFVVGVDGSEHAAAAVDVAFEAAALRGAQLRALYVWHPPVLGVLDENAAVQERGRVLSETVAGRTAAHPDVELHHEVVRGHPVQALTHASSTLWAWSSEPGAAEVSPAWCSAR